MANSKTLLLTYCDERHLQHPVYSTERGDGSKGYVSSVLVCERTFESQAIHSSIRLAEEDAARVAYNHLRQASTSASSLRSRSTNISSRSAGDSGASVTDSYPAVATRTGLAVNGRSASANSNDYSQKLESLCNNRGLSAPEYDVRESPEGKFTASVFIGDEEYSSNTTSKSYVSAKNYASLIALAEVGLSLLNINEREDGIEESLQRSEPECTRNSPPLSDHSIRSRSAELPDKNYKAIVQEYCQKNYLPLPEYAMEYSRGFVSVVTVCGNEYRSKPMGTKKKAEQNAAGMAALDMGLVTISESEGRGARGQANSPVNGASGLGLSSRSASAGFVPPASSLGSIRSQRTAAVPENITSIYKGMLQESLAKAGQGNPTYSTQTNYGGRFVSTVTLTDFSGDSLQFQGKAYSIKKTAEQSAAKQACIHFDLEQ